MLGLESSCLQLLIQIIFQFEVTVVLGKAEGRAVVQQHWQQRCDGLPLWFTPSTPCWGLQTGGPPSPALLLLSVPCPSAPSFLALLVSLLLVDF